MTHLDLQSADHLDGLTITPDPRKPGYAIIKHTSFDPFATGNEEVETTTHLGSYRVRDLLLLLHATAAAGTLHDGETIITRSVIEGLVDTAHRRRNLGDWFNGRRAA